MDETTVRNVADFGQSCLKFYGDLLGYAVRLTANKEAGQDLVQNSLERALKAWGRFVPQNDKCTLAWLRRIVRNTFITEYHSAVYKRERATNHQSEVLTATYGQSEDGVDPGKATWRQDSIGDEVANALAKLEPEYREVIVRADFNGDHYIEIAADLGIPLGTVMSRLHRARKRMKADLVEYARSAYRITGAPENAKRRSSRARKNADLHETPDSPEPETHGVDGVVAGYDSCELGL